MMKLVRSVGSRVGQVARDEAEENADLSVIAEVEKEGEIVEQYEVGDRKVDIRVLH